MNIDSDKLLEWFRDYIRHAAADTYAVSDHQRELLDIVFEELQDAIHSGELAAKAVYARAPFLNHPDDFTGEKEYEVEFEGDDGEFYIRNDYGDLVSANWNSCEYMGGVNWERVEK